VLINADPDALASAMALKRLFWRKTKPVRIFRINRIDRADNLALINLLSIQHRHIRLLKKTEITKYALLDSQPSHNDAFAPFKFDIIIDHHPVTSDLNADFIDIRDDYGANSTIMTEYLKAAKIKPSPKLATALFYGIKSDTNNFIRKTVTNDMAAFRHLYDFANLNIVKKIESSEFTRKTLSSLNIAMQQLVFFRKMALVPMGAVDNPDVVVIVADFFLKMAEATWSIVAGSFDKKLIVVFRNAGFRRHAGRLAERMFGEIGSAGGHKNAARAEIPLDNITSEAGSDGSYKHFLLKQLRTAVKR
jgi:nanoRNase/pAp phosphatase (c-di-AMP/oligoRNAs hydrolase)